MQAFRPCISLFGNDFILQDKRFYVLAGDKQFNDFDK